MCGGYGCIVSVIEFVELGKEVLSGLFRSWVGEDVGLWLILVLN